MTLLQSIQHIHPISQEAYNALYSRLEEIAFEKREIILREGEIQKSIYFMRSGVQYAYNYQKNKKHIISFFHPPMLSIVPHSFYRQDPSKFCVESITKGTMLKLSYEDLLHLYDEHQDIERLFRKIVEMVLIGFIARNTELHTLTIEERFKAFTQRSASLLQQVPHKYIASYLNISPTNFSKLYNSIKIQ